MTVRREPEIVTVGRIVHYVGAGGPNPNHFAAMVTATGEGGIEDSCALAVFVPGGHNILPKAHVPFDPQINPIPHSWHWPERDNGLKGMEKPK